MNNTFHTLGGVAVTRTITTTPPPQYGGEEESSIRVLQVVSYRALMPVVVAVGVAVNAVGLYLLHRPRMRGLPSAAYLKLLLGLDVAVMLVTVPNIFTLNGCHLYSYTVALYFVHPFRSAYYALQAFCYYVIVWVCYDRFLALWCFHCFHQTQQPRFIKLRITFTGLLCVAINLRHLVDVEVVCVGDNGIVEATNHTEDCEGGTWIILDSLHRTETDDIWHDVESVVRGVVGMIVPMVLVLVFSSGIVLGMVCRRLQNAAATTRTRDQAYSTIYITLALSLSFVTTVMTGIVYTSLYARNVKHCHGSFSQEVFRMAINLLLRMEHLTHILFLAINQVFRAELRTLLHATKNYLSNTITELAQTVCPLHQPLSETHSKETEGTSDQSPGDGVMILYHPQHVSQSVVMGSERNLPE